MDYALKGRIDTLVIRAHELAEIGGGNDGIEISGLELPEIGTRARLHIYPGDPPCIDLWVTGADEEGIEALKACLAQAGCHWTPLEGSWWLQRDRDLKVLASIRFPRWEAKAV